MTSREGGRYESCNYPKIQDKKGAGQKEAARIILYSLFTAFPAVVQSPAVV